MHCTPRQFYKCSSEKFKVEIIVDARFQVTSKEETLNLERVYISVWFSRIAL